MPSSHTSLVVGLATSVALTEGLGSVVFVLCLAFALIVMYDAAGVRRHAGKQAEVLNALVEDYFQGHPVSEQELKEVLGHTPLQVAMGALLGIVTAIVYHRYLV
jgi:acid phosphatase family membrane protein YuiD